MESKPPLTLHCPDKMVCEVKTQHFLVEIHENSLMSTKVHGFPSKKMLRFNLIDIHSSFIIKDTNIRSLHRALIEGVPHRKQVPHAPSKASPPKQPSIGKGFLSQFYSISGVTTSPVVRIFPFIQFFASWTKN